MRAPSRPTPGLGKRAESAQSPSPDVAAWERELRDALGTKVQLYRSRRGGRIIIHYFSDDQLQGLYDRLTAEP
jgi:ParB family transcriptional regulator, chromosome partitioning protein